MRRGPADEGARGGTFGQPECHIAYEVSKVGLIALSRTLGVEWAARGIRVHAVAPGYTGTQLLRAVGSTNPEVLDQWWRAPRQRLLAPGEIASVASYPPLRKHPRSPAGSSSPTGDTPPPPETVRQRRVSIFSPPAVAARRCSPASTSCG
ncbi:SDR family oxidoreductase [Sciscionella marina]|uniref:SDR family oxidoreductase n=1 Tax=Sciscionella marina TaxID=508770 RepID=UPI000A0202B2